MRQIRAASADIGTDTAQKHSASPSGTGSSAAADPFDDLFAAGLRIIAATWPALQHNRRL